MALSIGIVGLPNVGKSTLFRALTKKPVDISNYPFCTIEPNVGIVEVQDERLDKLAAMVKPEKVVPAVIKFVDVAGLVKGAHKGEGLGNQFLGHLRECDALLHIVRCFQNENIVHIDGTVDPLRDIETVETEMALKDLETEEKLIAKPRIYLLNCSGDEISENFGKWLKENKANYQQLDLRDELDRTELTDQERKELGLEESRLGELIKQCYNTLNLITFFTIKGGKETRAWPIKQGSTVFQGAGMVHSDFQDKFILAEVLNWQKLVEAGNWKIAAEHGWLQKKGKDYIIKEGDVIEIKI